MINVKNLQFKYPTATNYSLTSINFDIEKGQIFGFLGPSGAGKSTTQKILFKLLGGYEGSAKISGTEVRDWDKQLYKKIGVGFELPNHYLKMTALENLAFFQSFYTTKNSINDLLDWVGLLEHKDKKVQEFSKGMKMRLNFIRSLLHDPDILFFDEPTSGLDPSNSRRIKDIILDQKSMGKTIFITTHHMEDAEELCDQVAFLCDGKIQAMDSPANLKLKYGEDKVEVALEGVNELLTYDMVGLGNNSEFLKAIQASKIKTIHSKEASLNQIFMEVTGKSLLS